MFATPDVDAFEAAMAAKTRAEARRIAAQASLFELAGWSGVIAASGLAVWLGCLGVVHLNGENAKTQESERAFIERVANAPLKVEVVAKLADGTQVQLASGAQVTLAKGGMVNVSPDSTVGLDPHATVRAVADAPRPIQADARPASGAPVKTDVVQFNTVSYGKGEVVTGVRFADASQTKPAAQWCQYREPQPDGALRLLTIAKDGQRVGLPTPSPFADVDLQRAFASCVWASGASPPAHAPVERQASPPSPRVISARAKG